ncbi:MAG: LexA family transcriptional regulator [Bacteroidales bacterium]
MSVFGSNIKLLRKRKRRTQADIADALQIKRSTLSGYENGIAEPGLQTLILFSNYFQVAIDSLIKIDLSALSESELTQLERGYDIFLKGSNMRVLATTVDAGNNENIELVPEKAKAGYQRGFADPDFINKLPVFQLPFLPREKKFRTFQISGDSMHPIPDGAYVTGEYLQDWLNLKDGQAHLIVTLNEGVVFKLVENKLKNAQKLTVHSLNPLYEPYDIAVQQIKEIWRFTHYISSELPDPEVPEETLVKTVARLKQDVNLLKERLS